MIIFYFFTMSNYKIDNLFELIRSLSSIEKRYLRMYVGRLKINKQSKFMKLFNIMTKMKIYNEKFILDKTPVTKIQLSNIKAHLYKQILISLRLHHIDENPDLRIREYFDYSRILYNKGLYIQSIKYIEKAKILAKEYCLNMLLLELIEFEKTIELQLIKFKVYPKTDKLVTDSSNLITHIQYDQSLSNLSLQLDSLYIKMGHIKTEKDKLFFKCFFRQNLPKIKLEKLNIYELLSLYQCRILYHYILQDFTMCYKASLKWLHLFECNPYLKKIYLISYLKGYRYLLDTLFYLKQYNSFIKTFKNFECLLKDNQALLNDNIKLLVFICKYINIIHRYILEGNFAQGIKFIRPKLFQELKRFTSRLDHHDIMIIDYKIACLCFGSGDYNLTIRYLIKIIDHQNKGLRKDLQCFVRLLYLICCYEAGLYDDLSYHIKSVYKFFVQIDYWHGIQKIIVNFFKNLRALYPHQIKDQFKKLKEHLLQYVDHPYEKGTFLYTDIISWVSSKIENKSVEIIVKEKFYTIQN